MKLPEPGLYRSTKPYPGHEEALPAGVLVYIGVRAGDAIPFVVRPSSNRNNRWSWTEPVTLLRSVSWAETLKRLPTEGFYTLPRDMALDGGGRWLRNAIVQLGYNGEGKGILFVAELHATEPRNVLVFSDRGLLVTDALLDELAWAPVLPKNAADENGRAP